MKRFVIAVALTLAASPCLAETAPLLPLVPYENEGGFVVKPAKFIAAPVYGVGFMVGAFVCLPVSLVQQGSTQEPVPREQEASLRCGKVTGTALGWPVYAAVGLPLYLLKKGFYDFPKAVAHKISPPPPEKPEVGPIPAPAAADSPNQ